MNSVKVSATYARNNFFEILNQVILGKEVIVERDKKEVATISSRKKKGIDWEGLKKAMDALHGVWTDKDYKEWKKNRKNAKYELERRVGKKWLDG